MIKTVEDYRVALELTGCRRPFLYFPLQRQFEQQIHVPHPPGDRWHPICGTPT